MPTERCTRHIVVALLAGLIGIAVLALRPWEAPPVPRDAGHDGLPICGAAGVRTGAAGRAAPFRTEAGVQVAVVAPGDYDPAHAYGLLVAYPPAGYSGSETERFYELTGAATGSAWIVAYADHAPLSRAGIAAQAAVPAAVAARWCIDPARVALLGHSDGGTIAEGVALLQSNLALPATSIVASAAGIAGVDLGDEGCPVAGPDTLIVHNPTDARFPDYGAQAASFWAACLGCPPAPPPPPGACAEVQSCSSGRRLQHCATREPHERVPDLVTLALGFLNADHTAQARRN